MHGAGSTLSDDCVILSAAGDKSRKRIFAFTSGNISDETFLHFAGDKLDFHGNRLCVAMQVEKLP